MEPTSSPPVHQKLPEVADLSLEEIAERYVARFRDRKPDWNAFADAQVEGYHRAQHRFIGAGGSGKHGDPTVIPPGAFTLSVMYVPPGQGNAAHTHEVEEVFFVLRGVMTAFLEDESGRRVDLKLGEWECISCPAGVIHGFVNDGLEPLYFITMLGKGRPQLMDYKDQDLEKVKDQHLRS